jgi:hypothetical protein
MKANSLKTIALSIITFLIVSTLLLSCSKSKNSTPTPKVTSHKVIYKATTTDGNVNIVDYTNEQGQDTENSSLNTPSFTSPELTVPGSVGSLTFVATGSGGKATSTFTVQIYVDGKLVKSNASTGANLSSSVSYVF